MRLYEFSRGVPNGWNPGVRKTVGIDIPRRLAKAKERIRISGSKYQTCGLAGKSDEFRH
jgi:hypothetical protein